MRSAAYDQATRLVQRALENARTAGERRLIA